MVLCWFAEGEYYRSLMVALPADNIATAPQTSTARCIPLLRKVPLFSLIVLLLQFFSCLYFGAFCSFGFLFATR
jgi:hypothetical protein